MNSSIVDIQCFFLAGVYDRAVMKPLQAWYHTEQACSRLHIYLSRRGPLPADDPESMSNTRRLEQRLYWSCVRAESELLCELPLKPSALLEIDYPDSFPAPPRPPPEIAVTPGTPISQVSSGSDASTTNSEQSWIYYLAEIHICRIMDRETSLLYPPSGHRAWLENIAHYIDQVQKSDEQIQLW